MNRTKLKVLLVDDNEQLHEIIKEYLQMQDSDDIGDIGDIGEKKLSSKSGSIFISDEINNKDLSKIYDYEFSSFYQGMDVVTNFVSNNEKNDKMVYDFAIFDIRMPPGIDGIETLKKINAYIKDMPILICSAYSDYSQDQIKKLFSDNYVDFLPKPFTQEILFEKTLTIINNIKNI